MNKLQTKLTEFSSQYRLSLQMEHAIKLSPKQLNTSSLFAFDPSELPSLHQIEELTNMLGFSDVVRSHYEPYLSEANLVGVGIPNARNACGCNFYLEFWDKICHTVRSGEYDGAPLLMYLGYKRRGLDDWTVDEYYCFPLIPPVEIIERVRKLFLLPNHAGFTTSLVNLISFAASRLSERDSFVYLEVDNVSTGRRSFDVNLYKANLTLDEINGWIPHLAEVYELESPETELLVNTLREGILGHISGGVNQSGEPFLSLYLEPMEVEQ